MEKLEKFANTLNKFVPNGFEFHLAKLILEGKVKFKIVNERKTKLGDFRISQQDHLPIITVNGNLNEYAFLITALHELAHLNAFKNFGLRISPHGEEWKNEFRKLLLPIIESNILPTDIENALLNTMQKTKASSCSDVQLSRVLNKYDKNITSDELILEDLNFGDSFQINGRNFIKGKLRRSRYLCNEVETNKPYLIHRLAKVKYIENE